MEIIKINSLNCEFKYLKIELNQKKQINQKFHLIKIEMHKNSDVIFVKY